MNKLLIATFDSEEKIKGAQNDLQTAAIAGFPREKDLVDKKRNKS